MGAMGLAAVFPPWIRSCREYHIPSTALAEWPIPSGFGIMISSASVVFFRQHFGLSNGADVLTLCAIFQD